MVDTYLHPFSKERCTMETNQAINIIKCEMDGLEMRGTSSRMSALWNVLDAFQSCPSLLSDAENYSEIRFCIRRLLAMIEDWTHNPSSDVDIFSSPAFATFRTFFSTWSSNNGTKKY